MRNSKILAITERRDGGAALSRLPDQSTDHPLWQHLQGADAKSRDKKGKILQFNEIIPGDFVIVWRDLEAKIVNSRNWFMAEVEIASQRTNNSQEFLSLKVIDIETGISHWINKKLVQKIHINQLTPTASWCAN